MTRETVVASARHARNFYWGTDPHLHPLGVLQALKLGYHLRFTAGIKNPTIMSSDARRCRSTAWIVLLWFPEVWFKGHVRYFRTLNISQNAGEGVSELRMRKVMRLLWKHKGDVILITHHQLANTRPLKRFAAEQETSLTQEESGTKLTPGGACVLDLKKGMLTLISGSWVETDLSGGSAARPRVTRICCTERTVPILLRVFLMKI